MVLAGASQVLALSLLPVFNALVIAVMGMAPQEQGAGLGLLSPSHPVGTGWAVCPVLRCQGCWHFVVSGSSPSILL